MNLISPTTIGSAVIVDVMSSQCAGLQGGWTTVDLNHNLAVGPIVVHQRMRFLQVLESESGTDLEFELPGFQERDIFLKLSN